MTIPQALQIAIQHHQAGRLAEAETLYRQILATQPKPFDRLSTLNMSKWHADALHLLGVVAHQTGRDDLAVQWIRQAIALKPNNAAAYTNLGAACRSMGGIDDAIAAFRRAIQIKADSPNAHYNLGNALRDQGQLDDAIAAFRRAIEIKPDYAEAHNNLGNALRHRGQLDEAISACRRALELKPNFPEAHNNLGAALALRDSLDEAIALYRRALKMRPDFLEAQNNLGLALRKRGQLDEAIAAFRRAIEFGPQSPDAHNNLGNALKDRGDLDEALAAFRGAVRLKPDSASAHSNLVFTLHFRSDHDGRTIAEEHARWNRQFSDPVRPLAQPHSKAGNPERPLRVGYVSPDFRDHPVGRFVLPLFEHHDRERFEIWCYSGVLRPDPATERLRAFAAEWRNTVGVSDAGLVEMIREDEVDILVDLGMHTAGNRLPVFARQPAPVQVTWLAYPGSTGLPGIGYRLTDAHMDPPGEKPAWSAEEPVRLPDCWCCYEPAGESPEVNALPALSAGCVTFGSLNNFAKINEGVLALWARLMDTMKGSRLVMLCPEGLARERVSAFFGARGIAAERVELVGSFPRWEYLKLYHRIDLALDPFPCNGMTTTCDALWMGAPVLTLPGDMAVSRAGLSLLSSVGLGELAASSEDEYLRVAMELGGNLPRLAELRATLRARMKASPLMDGPQFARNVEEAYGEMWQARGGERFAGSGAQ